MTFLVKSKRTEASPSLTMGKMRETDSQAFGSEVLLNQYISKHMAVARKVVGTLGKMAEWMYLLKTIIICQGRGRVSEFYDGCYK